MDFLVFRRNDKYLNMYMQCASGDGRPLKSYDIFLNTSISLPSPYQGKAG